MKDIVLGAIRENTRELLKLANGKIKGKKIQIGLFFDSNVNSEEPSYFVVVRRIPWIISFAVFPLIQQPFNDKEKANIYFSSLVQKYNLTEVH